jgi:type IV secretion system protein VirB6
VALFIGFGPMFILFLLSDQTKTFFWKWLWYGIGTLFSLGVFVAMSSIVLDVVLSVAASFWVTAGAGALLGQNLTDGMTTVSMQQGGIGMLMTLLLIGSPPMAANFFQGAVGTFQGFNAFSAAGAAQRQPGVPSYAPRDTTPPSNQGRGTGDVPNARPNSLSAQQNSNESFDGAKGQRGVASSGNERP